MDKDEIISLVVSKLKHLQGRHNQKTHGSRYGSIDKVRRSLQGLSKEERDTYRKRAGMAEIKKVEKRQPKNEFEVGDTSFSDLKREPAIGQAVAIKLPYEGTKVGRVTKISGSNIFEDGRVDIDTGWSGMLNFVYPVLTKTSQSGNSPQNKPSTKKPTQKRSQIGQLPGVRKVLENGRVVDVGQLSKSDKSEIAKGIKAGLIRRGTDYSYPTPKKVYFSVG